MAQSAGSLSSKLVPVNIATVSITPITTKRCCKTLTENTRYYRQLHRINRTSEF